jgi:membrane fusion protein (multidrug efflux system)
MKRKITIVATVVGILLVGNLLSNIMADSKKDPPRNNAQKIVTVFTETVENGKVPVTIQVTGKLEAKNRIELFAEVQGVLLPTSKSFKEGISFNKGEKIVSLNAEVFNAGVRAQKSSFQNLLTATLADLKLDFPTSFPKWEQYVKTLDVNKTLADLPEVTSEQERMFLTGRNVYTNYYNVKNAELTLAKYSITAPFSGILTETNVTTGTLVRPGQKLGAFIQPTVFEMEAAVPSNMVRFLKKGQAVQLNSTSDKANVWEGKIVRLNNSINASTQTVNVYVEVKGEHLHEGLFMEANINATEIDNAIEIPRSVLFNENQVYTATDSILSQKTINPLFYKEKSVIVRGLTNGEKVVVKSIPGAYPGMKIKVGTQN